MNDEVTLEAETKGALKEMLKEAGLVQALVNQSVKLDNKTKAIPFNPGSRDQIAARLVDLGWEPTERTPDGRIKIDESVLKKINHASARLLLEYLTVSKRLGQVAEGENGWIKVVRKGRIHGKVNTNGAVTGRCTHSLPNLAQVPASRATYGKECRQLFKAGDGYDLVGVDASGLELRCLAHYLALFDNGAYAKNLLEDDIHTVNQKAAGLETRDQAKTFIYAFLYGAGDAKIGDIVGGTSKHGAALKKRFLAQLPALARLKKAVETKVKRCGYLTGIDGRILPIRSEHSALNMLLQSAGAVAMKQALIKVHRDLTVLGWKHGNEFAFVANVHDEFQAEVLPEKSDLYGKMAVEAIRFAGDSLGFKCPLDGEYKVGRNWAETH
jgi:DNA polymerase I-like protein with 3'-5' exonuclease and polymerase domains